MTEIRRELTLPGYLRASLLVLPIFFLFVGCGLWGVDFGYHWDEEKMFELVEKAIESTVLLPSWYKYPSITYWLSLSGLSWHFIQAVQVVGLDIHALQEHLLLVVGTPAYHLQTRAIFIILSALSIVWVYLRGLVGQRGWAESLLTAALLGLSWEVGYHARWIAPDVILMQFGALTVLFISLASASQASGRASPSHLRWLGAAASAAGFGCGTKYPGGLLIVPVLIAAYQLQEKGIAWRKLLVALGRVVPVFIAAYLVSTPGTLLEPIHFIKDVGYEVTHYQGQYDLSLVTPGLPHLGLMLVYLSRTLFSHYPLLAFFFFVLVLVGVYAQLRASPAEALMLLSFPVLYLVYFSLQGVMIVRNLLVLAPFLAIWAGRGAAFIWELLGGLKYQQLVRVIWVTMLSLALMINAAWSVWAAQSIRYRHSDHYLRQLVHYIRLRPEVEFHASARILGELSTIGETPSNLSSLSEARHGLAVFYTYEILKKDLKSWPKNQPGLVTAIFGPWEVNFEYYPLWAGDDRILVMPLETMLRLNLSIVP